MWDGLGVRCGVDTPYVAYRDTLHMPVEPQRTYRENVIWVDWQRDLRAFWMYHKQERLTLSQWLRSLRGEKMWAIYSKEDWKPGVAFTFNMLQDMWSVIRSGAA
jgi:predicted ATP-grasp superfamily ATP-dependent carboligase